MASLFFVSLKICCPLFFSVNSPGSAFYQGKWWPHLNQYGPSYTEPDWQTVATTAYSQTKPLQCGWERAHPTFCSKNVDPGLTLWVNKQLLPWTAPSLINLHNRDMYILVHAVFSNDLLCLLVLYWPLWCVWLLNSNCDHAEVTLNQIIYRLDGRPFWYMHSPLRFFRLASCQRRSCLLGATANKCKSEAAELFHPDIFSPTRFISAVTAGRVRRNWTRVISSHRAKSNGTQPNTKGVSRGVGKANNKQTIEVRFLTRRQWMSTRKHDPSCTSHSWRKHCSLLL